MIVEMKKVTVLGLRSHGEGILESLRAAGLVHVRPVRSVDSASLEFISGEITKTAAALSALTAGGAGEAPAPSHWRELVITIASTAEKIRLTREDLSQLNREADKIAYLGDFTPEIFPLLAQNGLTLRLYEISPKQLAQIAAGTTFSRVGENQGKTIIAAVFYGSQKELPVPEIPLPARSASQVRAIAVIKQGEMETLVKTLESFSGFRPGLERQVQELKSQKELASVRMSMGVEQDIIYIQGFCPAPALARLRQTAASQSWGLLVEEPAPEDEPPTLLKNSPFVRIIKPVFALIGTVPGYREFDINAWFLIFFSIFFAMLIGDGGYGALFFLLTGIAHYSMRKKAVAREIFYLMYVLSACTIVWGAITGVWFGLEKIGQVTPFKYFIIPSLNGFSDLSQKTVMNLCFILAVIQLSLAHLITLVRVIKSLQVISQIGWIGFMWGVFFLARNLVLGSDLPAYNSYLLGIGAGLVFFFSNPQKTIIGTLKYALINILTTFLGFISAFADTVSYLRLFAVGMTGLSVSASFLGIAQDVGYNNVLAGFGATLILVAAHLLNIVLGFMSVLVHGLRLNLLEFSGHVGMQWSGYEYNPFKKTDIKS
jgi:V/A-type H+-transporting ATPase subunit I